MPPKRRKGIKVAQPAKSRIRKAIGDLPVEMLRRIFAYVHSFSNAVEENTPERRASPGSVFRLPENRDRGVWLDHGHCALADPLYRKQLASDDDVVTFSFPLDTVAAVCHSWRRIVHSLPEFHSRFLIYLDKPKPTPISQIKAQVKKCTADVALDVLVTRRSFPTESNDAEMKQEKAQVRAVMKILAPLIPRCRSFILDVLHSASLPYISRDFRGDCPDLRVLKLECQIGDQDQNCLPDTEDEDGEDGDAFTCPNLTTLALDGYTFMDALGVSAFTSQLETSIIDELSIACFTSPGQNDDDGNNDEAEPFDIDDLAKGLHKIGHIRHLTLDVDVPVNSGRYESGDLDISMDHLTVIRSDPKTMEEFVSSSFGMSLCFYHLIETAITYDSIPAVHHLRLEKVPEFDYSFTLALTRFFGHRLDFIDCEGLTDSHLEHIANHCEPLRRLYITDCPDITIEGLKKFVSHREELAAGQEDDDGDDESDDDHGSDTESLFECDDDADELLCTGYLDSYNNVPPRGLSYFPIHRLQVSGHPKKLSAADRKWFREHVKIFHFK